MDVATANAIPGESYVRRLRRHPDWHRGFDAGLACMRSGPRDYRRHGWVSEAYDLGFDEGVCAWEGIN